MRTPQLTKAMLETLGNALTEYADVLASNGESVYEFDGSKESIKEHEATQKMIDRCSEWIFHIECKRGYHGKHE
tara:strand:- start:1407 stop:1628 length:222 start_codon:yes stop_codon:yes gene_type:complete